MSNLVANLWRQFFSWHDSILTFLCHSFSVKIDLLMPRGLFYHIVWTGPFPFSGSSCLFYRNRGYYMSAHPLLNLLNKLGKKIICKAMPSILSVFPNEFNKFNNTGARMQDSIYHMTLKSYFIRKFCTKTSQFRHQKTRPFYGRQCIFNPLVDYRF